MRKEDYKKKQQLRMKCNHIAYSPIEVKQGYSLVDSNTTEFSEEELSKYWTSICEELNGGFDENVYESLMVNDPNVYKGSTFYAKNPKGELVSTATTLRTENADEAILHMVGTKSDARGSGAASSVCAACVNYALRNGIKAMSLKTDDFRIPAIKIYYKMGFLPVLFDVDMRERWIKIAENIGWNEINVINENGETEKILVAD